MAPAIGNKVHKRDQKIIFSSFSFSFFGRYSAGILRRGTGSTRSRRCSAAASTMVPPPAKKRRLVASPSAADAAGVGVGVATHRPRLSAELLAKVASYSALGRDLLNLCVVAGPEDCALIRQAYLRDNFDYLEESLRSYIGNEIGMPDRESETCRDRYRAWMAVNTDWRKHVTEENVKKLKMAAIGTGDEGKARVNKNPFVPLCNPAVAIELRLEEVLVYLVEEKGIDVNSYRWTNYQCTLEDHHAPYHLLYICMICKNFEAFRYLLGRKDIDIHSNFVATNNDDGGDWRIVEGALYLDCCADFLQELLAHPSFDIVTSFTCNVADSPLHIVIDFLDEDTFLDPVPLSTWKAKLRLLLSAGADPCMEIDGINAIQYANYGTNPLHSQSKISAFKDAVKILEDWAAIK